MRWQQAEWADFGLEDIQTTRQAILDQLGEEDGAEEHLGAALEIAPSYEQAQRLLLELRARRSQS